MITLKLFQQIFYLEMHILHFAMPLVLLERPNSREKGNNRYKIHKWGDPKVDTRINENVNKNGLENLTIYLCYEIVLNSYLIG